MGKLVHGRQDRLRNKLYRFLGICCRDDFLWYTSDAMKVMESFEHYTKVNTGFNNIIAAQLGIVFNKDGKIVPVKSDDDIMDSGTYG